jgi:hypothetical protein
MTFGKQVDDFMRDVFRDRTISSGIRELNHKPIFVSKRRRNCDDLTQLEEVLFAAADIDFHGSAFLYFSTIRDYIDSG